MAEITEAYLLNLFNTERFNDIVIGHTVPEDAYAGLTTPAPKKHKPGASASVSTPMSLALLNMVTPGPSRERLRRDLQRDDEAVAQIEELQEIDDPLYKFFNSNSGIGLYLELWVCVNIPCPGCGGKLYKYNNPNMPVVDVRCINPSHTIGPLYYQIKATERDVMHNNLFYFSLTENYICVGSRRYGEKCHQIKGTSRDKRILIGYICIEYNKKDDSNIMIINNKSFILVPDLTNTKDSNYYTYNKEPRSDKIERISFDPDMMIKPITFQDRLPTIDKNVSLNLTYENIDMPLTDRALIKYLIMKMKYLNLKKNIKYININGK